MKKYAITQPCDMRDTGTHYTSELGDAGGVGASEYFGPQWKRASAVLKGPSDGTASADLTIRRAMSASGHVVAFDCMQSDGIGWIISAWQTYGEDPEWAFKTLANYKKPIWLSDFNYTGGIIDGEEKLALGLREMTIRLRKLSGAYNVEAAHIDELIGETYWGDHFEARMDLVKLVSDSSEEWRTGAPKSANHTMTELTGAIGSFRFTRQPSLEAADKAAVTVAKRECLTERLDERVEAQNRSLVAYVYCRINGRQPDSTDLHAHTRSLRSGTSIDSVILDWMGSDEFRNRLATLNDESAVYVAAVYKLMLDGADGFQNYVFSLDRGTMTSKNCSPPTS